MDLLHDPRRDPAHAFDVVVDAVGADRLAGVLVFAFALRAEAVGELEDVEAGDPYGDFVDRFVVRYKASLTLGSGNGTPADGYSLNIGQNLPTSGSEDGGGAGLTVAFDNFDVARQVSADRMADNGPHLLASLDEVLDQWTSDGARRAGDNNHDNFLP